MTPSSTAIMDILQTARGLRPYSMEDRETEQAFNVTLALLVELSASNDRIDRLERHIAELRGVPLDDVRNAHSDATADAERLAATEALMVRALRILIDPRTTVDGRPKARHQAGA